MLGQSRPAQPAKPNLANVNPPGNRGGTIVEPVGERMARELAPERAAERGEQAVPTPEPATAGELPFWSANE